jgi:pimeloyl-ACP methyl ester carboxylesterase
MTGPDERGRRLDPAGARVDQAGARLDADAATRSSSAADQSAPDPRRGAWAITVPGDGIRFAGLRWGPTSVGPGTGRVAVLLHGVQSNAATTSRMARALAGDGWNAVALDMPGHGETAWRDSTEDPERYARATVAGLVGDAVGALGARPALIGHSWGADIALAIAVSGRALECVVLIDPPVLTREEAAQYAAADIAELRPGDIEAARAVVVASGTVPDALDLEAKAQALTTIAPMAIEAVFLGEGMWRPQADARRWRDAGQSPGATSLGRRSTSCAPSSVTSASTCSPAPRTARSAPTSTASGRCSGRSWAKPRRPVGSRRPWPPASRALAHT